MTVDGIGGLPDRNDEAGALANREVVAITKASEELGPVISKALKGLS